MMNDRNSMIVNGVNELTPPDMTPSVMFYREPGGKRYKASLIVIRDGNSVSLPISLKVAEQLIAFGFSYEG